MSLINRPFRGFSGTFARPDLPLNHAEFELGVPDEVSPTPTRSPSPPANADLPSLSATATVSTETALDTPTAKKHLFTGLASIFSHSKPTTPSASAPRPRLSRHDRFPSAAKLKDAVKDHMHHAPKPVPAPSCMNQSNVVITYAKTFSEHESVTINAEIDQLYMAMYTKPERRQFYREAKRREQEGAEADHCGGEESAPEDEAPEELAFERRAVTMREVPRRSHEAAAANSLASSLTTGAQGSVFTAHSAGSSAASSICDEDATRAREERKQEEIP